MSELSAILAAYSVNEPAFLATVVQTSGSTYRRAGARLLMQQGVNVGLVSGGCLEADILAHTEQMSTDAIVVTYDHAAPADIIWGFGLGCNGMVQVLIERLAPTAIDPLQFIQHCFDHQQIGVVATVFQSSAEIPIGSRLLLYPDGQLQHNLADATLQAAIAQDAQALYHASQAKSTQVKHYELASGSVGVLLELIQPPLSLIIFGAGADALPVAQFAKQLGWMVTIVDCRANEATAERFAIADQVIPARREKLADQVKVDQKTIAVVMTHNYFDDSEILKHLISKTVSYIGVLGPKKRTAQILQALQTQEQLDLTELTQLHAPIGLDIGADTPEAIALAVIAEIQAVVANRPAGFLKHRQGPIHNSQQPAFKTSETAKTDSHDPSNRRDHSGSRSFNPHGQPQTIADLSGI
jgi:xanthine dehydrogenase accessory factor